MHAAGLCKPKPSGLHPPHPAGTPGRWAARGSGARASPGLPALRTGRKPDQFIKFHLAKISGEEVQPKSHVPGRQVVLLPALPLPSLSRLSTSATEPSWDWPSSSGPVGRTCSRRPHNCSCWSDSPQLTSILNSEIIIGKKPTPLEGESALRGEDQLRRILAPSAHPTPLLTGDIPCCRWCRENEGFFTRQPNNYPCLRAPFPALCKGFVQRCPCVQKWQGAKGPQALKLCPQNCKLSKKLWESSVTKTNCRIIWDLFKI